MRGSYFGPQRKSNRWAKWNYNDFGFYFITICTKDRVEYFGKVQEGVVVLNKLGEIAKKYFEEIPGHYKDVFIDEYIIMPNHVHGIILINKQNNGDIVGTEHCSVPTTTGCHYGLLSKIVKSYKNAVTSDIRNNHDLFDFSWQRSFYDHIIRNEVALTKIRQYIINNPINWFEDRNKTNNLYY